MINAAELDMCSILAFDVVT